MLGYEPHELIGRVPHQVMHHTRPDGSPYPADECPLLKAGAEGREIQVAEDLFWRRDGSSFPVQYQSHPLRREGAVVGFICTFRDISERKKNEERLRDLLRDQFALAKAEFQHSQLRDVLKQTPAVVCVTRGPRHLIEVVNDQFKELVGDHEAVGKTIASVLPAFDEEMLASMTLAYETGLPQRGQEMAVAVQTPDGPQTKFFDYIYQPLRDESGYVYGLMTARGRRHRGSAIAARPGDSHAGARSRRGAPAHGDRGRTARHLGMGTARATRRRGRRKSQRIHGVELGTFPGTFRSVPVRPAPGGSGARPCEGRRHHRQSHPLPGGIPPSSGPTARCAGSRRAGPFLGANGEPERVVGVGMDITDRKRAEESLYGAERGSRGIGQKKRPALPRR